MTKSTTATTRKTTTTSKPNTDEIATIDHQPRAIDANPLKQEMQGAESAVIDLHEKRIPLVMLLGPAGIGKSTLAQRVSERYGHPWRPHAPGTLVGMLDVLIEHRRDAVVALDDVDWFWRGPPDAINLLKRCTEIGKPRFISHTVGGSRSRARVRFEPGILLLSNANPSDGSHREHIDALKDRAAIRVFSFDPLDQYEFTSWLCSKPDGVLSNLDIVLPPGTEIAGRTVTKTNQSWRLPLDAGNDLLRHFAEFGARYPSLSVRTLVKFAARRVGRSHDEWLELIDKELLPEDQQHVFRRDGKLIRRLHCYQITPSRGADSDAAVLRLAPLGERLAEANSIDHRKAVLLRFDAGVGKPELHQFDNADDARAWVAEHVDKSWSEDRDGPPPKNPHEKIANYCDRFGCEWSITRRDGTLIDEYPAPPPGEGLPDCAELRQDALRIA